MSDEDEVARLKRELEFARTLRDAERETPRVARRRILVAIAASLSGGFCWVVVKPLVERPVARLIEHYFPDKKAIEVYNVNLVNSNFQPGASIQLIYSMKIDRSDCKATAAYSGTDSSGTPYQLKAFVEPLIKSPFVKWRVVVQTPINLHLGVFTLTGQITFTGSQDCEMVHNFGPWYLDARGK